MKTIVVANQKGGSGKSTVTVHLAVAAEQAGDGPIILSDTDPQGTAGDWFNQRKKAGIDTPRYAPLTLAELPAKIHASVTPVLRICLSTPRPPSALSMPTCLSWPT